MEEKISKEELYYDSRDNISKIHAIEWIPEDEVKGVLILVHGMAEYINRYDEFASYMAERGILVAGNDHLGHGKSIGEKDVPGYFCRQDAATVLVRDVHRLKKMVQIKYPQVPYIIMGHSMGSFVARNYLCRYGTGVDGAIIMGTGMPPRGLIIASKTVARIQGLFLGEKHPSKLLDKLAFGGYNNKIKNPLTSHDWLSVNEENVKAYKEDPLCGFIFTVNGFRTLFELIHRLYNSKNLQKIPKELPVLLIAGAQDPVGDYGRGIRRVEKSLRSVDMNELTVSLHPTGRHEILNERERQEVYEEIFHWIADQVEGFDKEEC